MNELIGRSVDELDTPAILIDLDVLERNIAEMASYIRGLGVNWRPHAKGHKSPAIAHKQLAAGAIGVTCAKLGEAEVMAAAGIRDILVANQIVGSIKVARLVNLCKHADVVVAVDSLENVREIDAAAQAKGVRPRVVVELNVGMERCGVLPGRPAVELSEAIAESRGLRYAGLMTWEGHTLSIGDPDAKDRAIREAVGRLTATADECRRAGLPVEIVSCGGTGTFRWTTRVPGITEVQAGGGVFGDLRYQAWGARTELAMTILTTVVSRPNPARIVVDAGLKTMSNYGDPRPLGVEGVTSLQLSAEHGRLELDRPNTDVRVGDRLEFAVGYSDLTIFMHDQMYGIRGGIVEAIWPVAGRGKLQ